MAWLRSVARPLREKLKAFKAWARKHRDQSRIQHTVTLAPEDASDKRRRRHVLVDLIHEHCPRSGVVVVEVGTKFGATGAHVLKYCPQVATLYAIDVRRPDPSRDRLAGLDRAKFIEGYSHEVALQFDDASVDLVFIDADHSMAAVKQDLQAWIPKVKMGGVISGHDYGSTKHTGVKPVVDAFFKDYSRPLRTDANKVWWTIR